METRVAADGRRYSREQFLECYGDDTIWNDRAHTSDAPQLADQERVPAAAGDADQLNAPPRGDALQLAAILTPQNVAAVRLAEANLGPPRSLHSLARQALTTIAQDTTYSEVSLDGYFPWMPYVTQHKDSMEIIGDGITHARGRWLADSRDTNRGGAPRLDFLFFRTDGTVCRLHPGGRPKGDARLVFEHAP